MGKKDIYEPWVISIREGEKILEQEKLPAVVCPSGELSQIGEVSFSLEKIIKPSRLELILQVGSYTNSYPLWVYPDLSLSSPKNITVTRKISHALAALEKGETVFLDPPASQEHFPHSIQAQFTTDFWSVGTFPKQSGFMGCYMDPSHRFFAQFPTEFHSNWQWWPMCRGRSMILPDHIEPL